MRTPASARISLDQLATFREKTDAIARIGENIRVRRFKRYQLGEEI